MSLFIDDLYAVLLIHDFHLFIGLIWAKLPNQSKARILQRTYVIKKRINIYFTFSVRWYGMIYYLILICHISVRNLAQNRSKWKLWILLNISFWWLYPNHFQSNGLCGIIGRDSWCNATLLFLLIKLILACTSAEPLLIAMIDIQLIWLENVEFVWPSVQWRQKHQQRLMYFAISCMHCQS